MKYFSLLIALFLLASCGGADEPVNQGKPFPEPEFELTDCSNCRHYVIYDSSSGAISCVLYEYDGKSELILKRHNAGFNCCPDSFQKILITVRNDTIILDERNVDGDCDCNCLYDLTFRIINLKPGKYKFIALEPLLNDNDKKIEFEADLTKPVNSEFCVDRMYYPWIIF